ncbi:MAG TPA: hypothetical protein VNW94_20450 [Streptosporangiaceae bacterium]|nr:hypothetical protein [Streptosporangiaceae bacterium]
MGSTKAAACAALTGAAVLAPSPAAMAGDVQVSPHRATVGARVTISAPPCVGPVFAESGAFAGTAVRLHEFAGSVTGSARIADSALSSTPWKVEVSCKEGGPFFGSLRVVGESMGPATGGGWLATAQQETTSSTGALVALSGLAATGLGAALVVLRRRRSQRS